MPDPTHPFLHDLAWRGQLHQCTDQAGLARHLSSGVRRGYVGFDPTADSLTIGNLVPITMLARLQRAGHMPVVVMGGGTGLIGDPSGKSAERQLLTEEKVAHNVACQRRIFERLLSFEGPIAARIVDNHEWLRGLGYIEALRDIGKHFSVNAMIQRDSVRERLHNRDQGISYTEFSYMILQAYDYLHLYRSLGVTLQMGGSDQWGNILSGLDLIRRCHPPEPETRAPEKEAFGLTTPLVTKADGGKFGKTETGAVWLTADRTSPYAFFQFWLNTADADVSRFLRVFTFLPHEEIEGLETSHASNPGAREAHRALARHMTELLHGKGEAEKAEGAAGALFSGDVGGLDLATLEEVFKEAPSSEHAKATLSGEGVALVDLLVATGLAKSKREAKDFLEGGGVTVNGRKMGADSRLTTADLLHGRVALLRRGKKSWHATKWA